MKDQPLAVLLVAMIVAVCFTTGCSDSPSAAPTDELRVATATAASYATATQKVTSDYAVDFRRLGSLVSVPDLENATWRRNVSEVVASIKAISARLRALQPPACLADVHATELDAASSYDQMADLLAAGVDRKDDDLFQESAAFLNAGNASIAQAAQLLHDTQC